MDDDSVNTAWKIDVTDADIRAAKLAWIKAQDEAYFDNSRVASTYDDYRRLVLAQAQQIADDFRAQRGR